MLGLLQLLGEIEDQDICDLMNSVCLRACIMLVKVTLTIIVCYLQIKP